MTVAAAATQALRFLEKHPDQVGSLMLCNPAPGVDPSRAAALDERAAFAMREGMRASLPTTLDISYPETLGEPAEYEAYRGRYLGNDPVGFGSASARWRAPTCCTCCRRSAAPPWSSPAATTPCARMPAAAELAKKIPGARFELIEAGHFMPTQGPEPLDRAARRFSAEVKAIQVNTMKIKANGIDINYQIDGPDGAPWIVFSNSLATSTAMWDEQAAALKNSFRVLRYDQRGHGGTDAPAGRYAFDTLLADALGLMDALSIKKAHFAGLSMGGATALGLAERHPDRFDRIIVCNSPCQSTPQISQQWEERIAVAQKQGIEALVEPTVARWFPAETVAKNPPHLDKVRAMFRATPVNGFIGCAAALADHDYASAIATVKWPVLFLVRREGRARRRAMRKLHEKLGGSRYVELPGAGHISNMDRPAEFTKAIREFIAAA